MPDTVQVYVPETGLGLIRSWIGRDLKLFPTSFVNTKILKTTPDKLEVLKKKNMPYCDVKTFSAQMMLRIAKYTPLDSLKIDMERKFKPIPTKKSTQSYEYIGNSDNH